MSTSSRLEVLSRFINDIDQDAGWWCNIGIPTNNDKEEFNYLFPSLSKIFGMHREAMTIFLIENNCTNRKSKKFVFCSKDYKSLMAMVDIGRNIEHAVARAMNEKATRRFLRI